MKITMRQIPVRELVECYADKGEDGVFAYGGNLTVRPIYQREFVYKDKQRDAVIDTVNKWFPLNVLYWADNGGGKYEVLDGQQRIISICQYVTGKFSIANLYYHNLKDPDKEKILDYELMVYFCEGDDKEKLDWFRTINIAGEKLTSQELRNAVYAGPWVSDAKRYFSKTGCAAYSLASDYMRGSPIRQEYLETAIKWLNEGDIEGYMAKHQHESSAADLWEHFQDVIKWVESKFTVKRVKEMRGVDWGLLYNIHKNDNLDPVVLEEQISDLMDDEEVIAKSGIYYYVFDGREKHLNLRTFSDSVKRTVYGRQSKKCKMCKQEFAIGQMEADHIKPWSMGGKTDIKNCQMLCAECHQEKTSRQVGSQTKRLS